MNYINFGESFQSIPNVHQSTALPCPTRKSISGAKYSGVPHTELAPRFPLIPLFERPKSVNLIYPSLSINTFSGLRLRQQLNMYKIVYELLSIYNIF